ncbi:9655_t:CDS:10 [Funneliformis geosporum]|uniref:15817_t:CDS:1 n=1 Tax=Funneliformis geosporum TaxID=1117311 RepID=A0A9W4SCY5_9GLOM|nr:9655_t:CDS:10 [Funneliformis geosporum]CAI2164624.1 15817_t:CDS:10 [Funneliformis geosporum]
MTFWKSKTLPSPKSNTLIPEANANVISKLIFWWAGNIMRIGYKRPLEKDDLYVLNDPKQAKNVTDEFEKSWEKECTRSDGKNPSLLRALNRTFGFKFWISGIYRFLSDTLQVASPLFVQLLLKFAQESWMNKDNREASPNSSTGFLYTVIIFVLQMGSTFFVNLYFYSSMEVGFLVRTAMITAIYRKAMVLSGKARNAFTTGKITNLMSTDTTRLDFVSGYFHVLWAAPIQLCIALGILIKYLGPSALAGFGFLFIMTPFQGKVMRTLGKTRSKAAKITDERVKITQEVLQGIRVIKYYAWEESFLETLNNLRDKEMGYVRLLLSMRAGITGVTLVIPVFASIIAFIVYSLSGGELKAEVIFPSLALFNIMRLPLMFLPMVIAAVTDAWVSVKRIQELFVAEQLDYLPKVNPDGDYAIKVDDGEFIWENNETANVSIITPMDSAEHMANVTTLTPYSHLRNINLSIPRGKFVAVVGTVGSGKSSLLSALVGEMKKVHGEIEFGGSVGYCPQTSWIQNATLRDNIIFGLPFNDERYHKVIKDCCLEPDLAMLPDGDLTEIGEKGINLSGGQKQRVNIARAVYYDADIVLLDDPLSAVDSLVGNHLITNCIKGALKEKTRILVTHHLHVLPQVDYVICMENGKIAEQGTYEELMRDGKAFAKLIEEYGEAEAEEEIDVESADEKVVKKEMSTGVVAPVKALMTTEERSTGSVDNTVYFAYVRAAGGYLLLPLLFFLLVMMQVTNIGQKFNNMSKETYMGIYLAWGISQGIFSLLGGLIFSYAGSKAAKTLHRNSIKRVLRAPTKFFDTTPLGRIINRFSKDIDTCDNLLSDTYRMFLSTLTSVIGTFILISIIFVYFLIPLVPLLALYYFVAIYYRSTNRELKRLDSVLRSSLYAHFSESLTGLPTIRAYREQDRFLRTNEQFVDIENRAYFLIIVVQRWLGIRLESIANTLIFFTSLFSVIGRYNVNPAIIGLVLTYALQVTGTFNWCVRQFAEVEANMNAVERLVYYSESLDVEAEPIILDHRPPSEWPVKGEVHVKDLVMSYGPDLPPVLKGVTFDIVPSEKVGIVGRTGCGKSTLATSFFRFIEPISGKIELDGIDITTIGLKDLRSKITIIPQDPVLFNGTLRSNLDPFKEHDDATLWNSLRRAHLIQDDVDNENTDSTFTESLNEKSPVTNVSVPQQSKQEALTLDSPVNENGSNFSQGQQQLIALARALVRHSKLIIMDEATASVDFKTDHLIQTTIREEFKDSTVLTIAHRLRTVADYDKILVMGMGMCERSGELDELLEVAKEKYERDQKEKDQRKT